MAWVRILVFGFATLLGMQPSAVAFTGFGDSTPEFLPVDEAFQLQVDVVGDEVRASWHIAPGYYLYQERMSLEAVEEGASLAPAVFHTEAKLQDDPYFGLQPVFHEQAEMGAKIVSAPGDVLKVKVTSQGCADAGLCYPPRTQTLSLELPESMSGTVGGAVSANLGATSEPSAATASSNAKSAASLNVPASSTTASADGLASFLQDAHWLLIVATFFVLGLGLTFTPCVLPMVPILSGIIVGQRERPTTPRAFALSLGYVLGMASTYAAAGVAVGYFGARANIQAWMQQPWVLGLFGLLFVALALAMFGLYELQLPAAIRNRLDALSQRQKGGQMMSVIIMGVLSALVVSPCVSAPLAGALLYISTTGDAVLGGSALFALAMGMGVPLLIIGTLGTRILPKAGAWMERVKQAFGVMLLAVALWLVERVLPTGLSLALWALLLIGAGLHLGALRLHAEGWARSLQALGIVVLLWGVFVLWGAAQGAGSLLKPIPAVGVAQATTPAMQSPFQRIRNEAELQSLLASGQPLMLDFYADWCVSCIVMEKEIFQQPEVLALKDQLHFVQLDITKFNTEHQALLTRLQLVGPPAVLFFDAAGQELREARIVGEVSLDQFLRQIEERVLPPLSAYH